MKESLWNLINFFLLFYCLLTVYAYLFHNRLIFLPHAPSYNDSPQIIKIPTSNGQTLSAIYQVNPQAKYTVLISHGNVEDIGRLVDLIKVLNQHCLSVLAYDYQGYGTSTGKPTVKNALQDIRAAFNYLTNEKKIDAQHIILYGRSVGTGPTLDLAATHTVAGIILQSAFLSAYRVVTHIPLIPFDVFKNNKKISAIHIPILFIHGTKDEVIPFYQGKRLYQMANTPKYAYWIENGGHNDLFIREKTKIIQKMIDFVKTLDQKTNYSACDQ